MVRVIFLWKHQEILAGTCSNRRENTRIEKWKQKGNETNYNDDICLRLWFFICIGLVYMRKENKCDEF
jgi:hypothetical protein